MRQAKKIGFALFLLLMFFICNLDFPYDPLDPSRRTHYSTFRQMATASLLALGMVALLPVGLFLFVAIGNLSRGQWKVRQWAPEFCRNIWRRFTEGD